jgi:hypothetical protein
MKTKILRIALSVLVLTSIFAFTISKISYDGAWYKCSYCCKTKLGSTNNAPWESGCNSSSGTHNYQFSGHAGNFTWACRNCKAEVVLKQGTTPAAGNCCANSNISCNWYLK